MGYIQIDGNKNLLIHENGSVRLGLRNLPDDRDRFIYARDKKGKLKTDVWPKLIVATEIDGREDVRLLPEVVLKHHGKLPAKLECTEDDFEAKDGDKTNCSIENLEYVGDGSFKQAAPYKGKPKAEKADKAKDVEPEETPEEPAEESPQGSNDSEPPEEPPKYAKSMDLSAKDAIATIRDHDFQELTDMGFLSDDEDRITVKDAWESAEKAYKKQMEE